MLEYGTLQDHIAEILSQYNEGSKPGTYMIGLSWWLSCYATVELNQNQLRSSQWIAIHLMEGLCDVWY